jgi:hypothetical protein
MPLPPLFAVSVGLSALLLFLVQPIIAKQILPWYGGAASVWTTCMVFFQTALLAGYAYAHTLATRLTPGWQRRVHLVLLAASLACLPIVAAERWRPAVSGLGAGASGDAALSILLLLAATVGLPYLALAATGPLLQSWLVRRFEPHRVYRLFALSNAGSLVGLLAYPLLIEPRADATRQAWGWSLAYAAFAAACAWAAWRVTHIAPSGATAPAPMAGAAADFDTDSGAGAGGAGAAWVWLGLAALGVVILLAATAHIGQNVASAPFLWIVPLVLYLLSFVIAFEGNAGRGLYGPRWGIPAAVCGAVLMSIGLTASSGVLDVHLTVPLYCGGVLFTCLFCHGELAARRPGAAGLTRFYLMISLGGALGGAFVGLVAPRVFRSVVELPLALAAVCACAIPIALTQPMLTRRWRIGLAALASVGLVATAGFDVKYEDFIGRDVIRMQRNFYGTLRVREVGAGDRRVRRLLHGVILHGEQALAGPARRQAGTYYSASSGVGLAIGAVQSQGRPLHLGVIGLGTGTLAAYGRDGDSVTFYEIDADVASIARSDFSYLGDSRAAVRIVLGDGRLSLQHALDSGAAPRYDVLAIDAFASDSIPVHLLTREAVALYSRCLAPGGLIAVHISNRFLDLKPVLASIADDLGLHARLVRDDPPEGVIDASSSDWVLIGADTAAFARAPIADRAEDLPPPAAARPWTDQSNDLLHIIKGGPLAALRRLFGD